MVPSHVALLVLFGTITHHHINTIHAFTTPNHHPHYHASTKTNTEHDSSFASALHATPKDSAKALTDYMVKAHEEKLKAIQDMKNQKDAQLEALTDELEALKASRGASSMELFSASSPAISSTTSAVDELAANLASYQKFMADYIVNASEQKYHAVKQAEMAMAQKYKSEILLLSSGGSSSSAKEEAAPIVLSTIKNPAFEKRNAKITAAAAAGKGRWGEMEVEKAQAQQIISSLPLVPSKSTPTSIQSISTTTEKVIDVVNVPMEVIEADHGLRADGGVGGLTLAERVMLGSQASSTDAAPAALLTRNTSTYEKRNSFVLKSAEAGMNYRWGDAEVANVKQYEEQNTLSGSSSSCPAEVDVNEADHGLRADGGVGGPSLSDRVNLGAALMQSL